MRGRSSRGSNGLSSEKLSGPERLAEVAEILALGILRLRTETLSANSADSGDSSLHFSPAESGHPRRRETVGRRT